MRSSFKKNKNKFFIGTIIFVLFAGIGFSVARMNLPRNTANAASGAVAGAFNYMAGEGCAFVGSSWTYNSSRSEEAWEKLNNYYDTCYGASWREYSVDSLSDSGCGSATGSWYNPSSCEQGDSPSAIKNKCAAIDATTVYRYAYEVYTPSKAKASKDLLSSGTGKQGPSLVWGQSKKYLQYGISGTVDSSKIEEYFKLAAKWDNDGSDSTIDNKALDDVSWFCYNPEWEKGNGHGTFESETYLTTSTGGNYQSGTDTETTETLGEVETDSVTLTFYHKIRYNYDGRDPGKIAIDKATTDWTVYDEEEQQKGSGKTTVDPGNKKNYESEELKKETVTVTLAEGEEKEICRRIEYSPKTIEFKYDAQKSKKMVAEPQNDENGSGICITVSRKPKDEEEDPKTGTNSKKFKAYFNAMSKVSSVANNFDIMKFTAEGDWTDVKNGKRSAEIHYFFSTDKKEAKVTFEHWLKWDKSMWDVDAAIQESGIKSKEDETVTGLTRKVQFKDDEGKTQKVEGDGEKIHPDGTEEHPYAATTYEVNNQPSGITEKKMQTTTGGVGSSNTTSVNGLKKSTTPTDCSADKTQCGEQKDSGVRVWESNEYTIEIDTIDQLKKAISEIKFDSTVTMEIKENLVSGTKWKGNYYGPNEALPSEGENTNPDGGAGAGAQAKTDCTGKHNCVVDDDENAKNAAGQQKYVKYQKCEQPGPNGSCLRYSQTYSKAARTEKYEETSNGLVRKNWELKVVKVENARASSKAAAEVVRPGDPIKSSEIPGPINEGDPTPEIRYAGEGGTLIWKAKTGTWGARQVVRHSAVAFLLKVSEDYSDKNLQGNIVSNESADDDERAKMHENKLNPCEWYTDSSGGRYTNKVWCAEVDQYSFDLRAGFTDISHYWHATDSKNVSKSDVQARNAKAKIIVPNDVGRKYCHSNGYHWQYYYGISKNGTSYTFTEITDGMNGVTTNMDYWTNYDAACKTIAKKPSVAVWNSGIFANGSVNVSRSDRQKTADDQNGPIGYSSANEVLYSSWAEYLVSSSRGSITNFASGATLSRGGNSQNDFLSYYSPMSISNFGPYVGYSNIGVNNALVDRLQTYFGYTSIHNLDGSSASSPCTVPGNGLVKLVRSGSSIKIDCSNNIEINGSYASIYQIPQMIYLSDGGNISVGEKISRLDAWLIAPRGTVDTCGGFIPKTTTTAGIKVDNPNISGAKCDKQLTINGPVIAKNVKLNRTFGADPQRAYANPPDESNFYTPAEVFNLSAENYLWAYAQAGRYKSSYTDAYARELPPRY